MFVRIYCALGSFKEVSVSPRVSKDFPGFTLFLEVSGSFIISFQRALEVSAPEFPEIVESFRLSGQNSGSFTWCEEVSGSFISSFQRSFGSFTLKYSSHDNP